MSVRKICTVFDSKVGSYGPPFSYASVGEAIRSFTDACREANSPFARHPADYRLFHIADYDDSAGRLVCPDNPIPLIGADELGLAVSS